MAKIITKGSPFTGHIGPVAFVKGEGSTEVPTALAYFRRHPDRYEVTEDEQPTEAELAAIEDARLAAEKAEADRLAAEQEAAQAAEAARLEAEAKDAEAAKAAKAAEAEQADKPKRRRKPAEKADDKADDNQE